MNRLRVKYKGKPQTVGGLDCRQHTVKGIPLNHCITCSRTSPNIFLCPPLFSRQADTHTHFPHQPFPQPTQVCLRYLKKKKLPPLSAYLSLRRTLFKKRQRLDNNMAISCFSTKAKEALAHNGSKQLCLQRFPLPL